MSSQRYTREFKNEGSGRCWTAATPLPMLPSDWACQLTALTSGSKRSSRVTRSNRPTSWSMKPTLDHADIFDYVEAFYNRTRQHSHLNSISPEGLEQALS